MLVTTVCRSYQRTWSTTWSPRRGRKIAKYIKPFMQHEWRGQAYDRRLRETTRSEEDRKKALHAARHLTRAKENARHVDVLAAIELLVNHDLFEEAARVFNVRVKTHKNTPEDRKQLLKFFTTVMSYFAKRGEASSTARLLLVAKKRGLDVDATMYAVHMDALMRRGSVKQMQEVHDEMISAGIAPSTDSFNFLLVTYYQVHDTLAMRRCLEQMRSLKLEPNQKTNGMIMGLCSREGDLKAGMETFQRMLSKPKTVAPMCWARMAWMLGRAGYWKEASDLFHRMETEFCTVPEGANYHAQMMAMYQTRDYKGLEQIVARAAKERVMIPVPERILTLWFEVFERNVEFVRNAFDLFIRGSVNRVRKWILMRCLHEAIGARDWKFAFDALQKLEIHGHKPRPRTLGAMMHALSAKGDAQGTRRVVETARRLGFDDEKFYCSSMVNAHANAGEPEFAEEVLREAIEEREIPPDTVMFNSVLKAHARRGQPERCREFLILMKHAGLRPDLISYNILAYAYASVWDADNVEQVVVELRHEGLAPDVRTYNMLLKVYLKLGNLSALCECWGAMEAEKVRPNEYAFATLLAGLAYGGRVDEATVVLQRMLDAGMKPKPSLFDPIVRAYSSQGQIKRAVEVYNMLRRAGGKADHRLYKAIVQALVKAGTASSAAELLEEAAHALDPTEPDT